MNPFKVTSEEYEKNFDEKKNFIKSLIFLIYKGNSEYTKVQETILNKVVFEYYEEYFHPFNGYSDAERKELRERLLLTDKTSGAYDKFVKEQNEKFREEQEAEVKKESQAASEAAKSAADRAMEKIEKLRNLANDPGAAEGEVIAATRQIQRLLPETMQDRYLMEIDHRIDEMEDRRKQLRVTSLSFNTFYEFSLQRIPQLMEEMNLERSKFDIHDYAAILSTFYKGGEYEETLNSDMETSLFCSPRRCVSRSAVRHWSLKRHGKPLQPRRWQNISSISTRQPESTGHPSAWSLRIFRTSQAIRLSRMPSSVTPVCSSSLTRASSRRNSRLLPIRWH